MSTTPDEDGPPPPPPPPTYDEEAAQISEIAQCDLEVARTILKANNGMFETSLNEALSFNGPTLLCVGIVNAQFEALQRSLSEITSLFPATPASNFRTVTAVRMSQMDAMSYLKDRESGTLMDANADHAAAFIKKEITDRGLKECVGLFGLGDGYIPLCDFANAVLPVQPTLFGNSTSLTEARRDKYSMQHILEQHDVPCARSIRCSTSEEARAALEANQVSLPVVVKPTTGAGTEFVTQCETIDDVVASITCCEGYETTQVTKIDAFCIQEFLTGTEYVVDVVSHEGVHVVTDVWRSFKNLQRVKSTRVRRYVQMNMKEEDKRPEFESTTFIYDKQEFISNCGPDGDAEAHAAVEYVLNCLDALDYRNGSSHTEIMFTKDGPKLIEVNPRQQGDVPRSFELVGYDQQTLTAYLASVGPEALRENHDELWPPKGIGRYYKALDESKTKQIIFFNVLESGIACERGKEFIRALPTFERYTRSTIDAPAAAGKVHIVEKTHDIFSCPGAVVLFGEISAVSHDAALIRQMENNVLEGNELFQTAVAGWQESIQIATEDLHERRAIAEENEIDPTSIELDPRMLDFRMKQIAEHVFESLHPPPLFISQSMFVKLRETGLVKILRPKPPPPPKPVILNFPPPVQDDRPPPGFDSQLD